MKLLRCGVQISTLGNRKTNCNNGAKVKANSAPFQHTQYVKPEMHEITAADLDVISGGSIKLPKMDFTIKANTNTSGTSTIEASLTIHF